ncbi:MAG: hypothetical protein J6J12_03935 [Oscillospiraceae bacterium]|nr:hypothetical protein [Oscillospiraceae bacterium]
MTEPMEGEGAIAGTLAAYLETEPSLEDFLSRMAALAGRLAAIHGAGCLCLGLTPQTVCCRETPTAFYGGKGFRKAQFLEPGWGTLKLKADRYFSAPEVWYYTGSYLERRGFAEFGELADAYSFGKLLEYYGSAAGKPLPQELKDLIQALTAHHTIRRQPDNLGAVQQQLNTILKQQKGDFL